MNTEQTQFQEKLRGIYRGQDKIEALIEGLEEEIPQKSMKDYYIKLQTLVEDKKQAGNEKSSNNKQEVEVENIFDPLQGQENSEVNKLLILGGAGVGKSTLMRYMAYKWGEGELWKDKFDFVYRVPLKVLLNQDWKIGRYNPDDLDDSELKCLVHYNLTSTMSKKERQDCRLDRIIWRDEKNSSLNDRILLLLDGYDEVAHLQRMKKNNNDFEDIFEEIFEFKNIILTSRPNAVTSEMAKQFHRTIENSGLGNEGINQYFSRYFKDNEEKGKELNAFLTKNPSIREICNIPVNIAMLCFIWTEPESASALQKISNMSDLYGHVVDHLGFRFRSREQPKSDQKIDDLGSLWRTTKIQLDELQVLQHVAFRGLIGDGLEAPDSRRPETLIIRGMIARDDKEGTSVQSSINCLREKLSNRYLTINSVYKYGLLKTEGLNLSESTVNSKKDPSEDKLLGQSFSFIHLSFQEYLTAQYLVEQLVKGKDDQKTRVADFIACHRNEPRYSLILKFMAGIFRADSRKKDEDFIKAIKIFWDAIVCNPNGALEFGIDAKVNLLMHLLSQSKDEGGQIDERIPSQDLMVKFIDYQMLGGLTSKIDEWKASDYMSADLKEDLLRKVLDEDDSWGTAVRQRLEKEFDSNFKISSDDSKNEIFIEEEKQEFLRVISANALPKRNTEENVEAFGLLIHHFSVEEQEKVVQKLLQDIKNENGQENKVLSCRRKISTLTKVFQTRKLNPEDSRAFTESLFVTIFDNVLGDVSLKGILETVKASDNPSLKDLVRESLIKCQIDPEAKDLNVNLESVIQLLRIIDCGQDTDIIGKFSNLGVSLLSHPSDLVKEAASRLILLTLYECGGSNRIEFIQDLVKSLTPLLNNSSRSTAKKASEVLSKLVSSPTAKANIQVLRELALNIIQADTILVSLPILDALELHFLSSDPQMMKEIIKTLISHLRDSEHSIVMGVSKRLLEKAQTYSTVNANLIQDIIPELTAGLENSDSEIILDILKRIRDLALAEQNTHIHAQAIKVFTPLLCSKKDNIQNAAIHSVAALFKASQHIDKSLFFETLNFLVQALDPSDPEKTFMACHCVKELVLECDISDLQWIREIRTVFMPFIKESNHRAIREGAFAIVWSLLTMKDPQDLVGCSHSNRVIRDPQLLKELIDIFTSKLSEASHHFRMRILIEIAELEIFEGNENIERVNEIIKEVILLMKDQSKDVDIVETLTKKIFDLLNMIENVDVQLLRSTIEDLISILGPEKNLAVTLVLFITKISKINQDKDTILNEKIIPILVPYLRDFIFEYPMGEYSAIIGVARLMKNCTKPPNPQLAGEMINALVRFASSDSEEIADSIKGVTKLYTGCESRIRGELIEILIPHLEIENSDMKKTFRDIIKELTSNKDAQLFERVHDILNQQFQKTSEVRLQVLMLDLRTEVEMMNDDGNIQRAQDLITIFRPYLKSEGWSQYYRTSVSLIDLMTKSPNLRDTQLVQEIIDTQYSVIDDTNYCIKEEISIVLTKLATLVGAKDRALLKSIILTFLYRLKNESCSCSRKEFLESFDEIVKIYGEIEIEFMKEIVEKVTAYFDEKNSDQLSAFIQRLSVLLISQTYIEAFEGDLDHPNKNLRQNFRIGVFNYFKTYLNRFEVMESLMSKHLVKELTLEKVNEKLFDGGLDEAAGLRVSSSLNLLKDSDNDLLEQHIMNLKMLIAHEIDLVEMNKGIRPVQVAYIAIYRSEFSEYEVEKELPELAREVLNNFVVYFTEEKLEWINDNHDKLAKLAPPVHKILCTKLYHKMLEDRVITPLEEKMITVFLQQGLTTSITNQAEIIFQDIKYQIEGSDTRFMLERIAKVIIKYGQDLLAQQYKMNIPLFEKSYKKGGMQEAAIDIRKEPSLVDERIVLRSDFWLLTSLKPLNTTSELILLEQRSAFGNHVVFKLEGETFKEWNKSKNLEEIFGQYQSGLIYLGRAKRLSPQIGQELVKNTWATKFADVEGSQVGKTGLYYQQELLGGGKEDRIMRALSSKQDNPLRALEEELTRLDSLSPDQKVALQEYYEGFIATFGSVYAVSQIIEADKFTVNIEKDSKFSPIGLFTTLVALIPYGIGEKLSEGIDKLALSVKTNKVMNEAAFMTKLAMNAVDLSDRISKIALKRIAEDESRLEILDWKDPDPEGIVEKIKGLVESKMEELGVNKMKDKLKDKLTQVTKIDNLFAKEILKSPAFRLGESQANEIIQEWFKYNHAEGTRLLDNESKRSKFIQLIMDQNNVRLKAKKNKITLEGDNGAKSGCFSCEIF